MKLQALRRIVKPESFTLPIRLSFFKRRSPDVLKDATTERRGGIPGGVLREVTTEGNLGFPVQVTEEPENYHWQSLNLSGSYLALSLGLLALVHKLVLALGRGTGLLAARHGDESVESLVLVENWRLVASCENAQCGRFGMSPACERRPYIARQTEQSEAEFCLDSLAAGLSYAAHCRLPHSVKRMWDSKLELNGKAAC